MQEFLVKAFLYIVLGIMFAGVKEVYLNPLGILFFAIALIIIFGCAGKVGKTKTQNDNLFRFSTICIIMPFIINLYQRENPLPPMTGFRFFFLCIAVLAFLMCIGYVYGSYWEPQWKKYHNEVLASYGLPDDVYDSGNERRISVFKVRAKGISSGREGVYVYPNRDIVFKYGMRIIVQDGSSAIAVRVINAYADEMFVSDITPEIPRVLSACEWEEKDRDDD